MSDSFAADLMAGVLLSVQEASPRGRLRHWA